jgi:hypothetical protein
METCSICSKTFKNSLALSGHSRWHKTTIYKEPIFDYSVSCIFTKKKMHITRWEDYQNRVRNCQCCKKLFEKIGNTSGLFCSKSCSATENNKKREPVSDKQKQKTSNALKTYFDNHGGRQWSTTHKTKIENYKYNFISVNFSTCICGKIFLSKGKNWKPKKHCSTNCRNEALSENRIKFLQENGTSNFSTRIPGFCYKNITIDCDSKLEAAAVQYLIDVKSASHIERCESIVNFYDKHGKHHRFLPDFFVRIDYKSYIVEVKQVYRKSSYIGDYNQYFEEKKKALLKFCDEKNLEMLWLDFDYDKLFEKMYRKFLKENCVKMCGRN